MSAVRARKMSAERKAREVSKRKILKCKLGELPERKEDERKAVECIERKLVGLVSARQVSHS